MHTPSTHSETELLLLASQGNQQAFTALFLLHKHKLYSFLLHLTQSPEATEDIIQELFLKLWQKKELLESIENFSQYLFRMAQNKAVSIFRKAARETLMRNQITSATQSTSPHETAEALLITAELQQKVQDAINKLSPQQKAVYMLSREKGLKHDEIARKLGISTSTVNNHMIQALRVMRQELAPYIQHTPVYVLALLWLTR